MYPHFANVFAKESVLCWRMIDPVSNVEYIVFYNMNIENSRLTTGWVELKDRPLIGGVYFVIFIGVPLSDGN
jgi:hypothetical protein